MTTIDRIRDLQVPLQFPQPQPLMSQAAALAAVTAALARWHQASRAEAERVAATLAAEFPDQAQPDDFWQSQASAAFRDFFVWGHDHDFGHGVWRRGAMASRHVEITSEAIRLGLMPAKLNDLETLDVGCWSGGDLLVLAGLGAAVTAIEEHPVAARAARRLIELSGVRAKVEEISLFADRQDWAGRFDFAYCAGVIYHVTDPLLFLRVMFAYLKCGGEIFVETKSVTGEGSVCGYSGTLEKGWNWYAPNETVLGRWLVDAGFEASTVRVHRRENGRLLAAARKTERRPLRETAGFSRPGSWLEASV